MRRIEREFDEGFIRRGRELKQKKERKGEREREREREREGVS